MAAYQRRAGASSSSTVIIDGHDITRYSARAWSASLSVLRTAVTASVAADEGVPWLAWIGGNADAGHRYRPVQTRSGGKPRGRRTPQTLTLTLDLPVLAEP